MPSERFQPRQPGTNDFAVRFVAGQLGGENPEVGPDEDVPQRQTSRMEALVGDDSVEDGREITPKHQMALKNGATIDVATGAAAWNTLNSLLYDHSELVRAVLAKARGEGVSNAMQRELRRAYLTLPSGELREGLRDVILSGYQETAEGPVVANPFRLESEADRKALEDCEYRRGRNILRFDRLLDEPGPPPR